MTDVMERVTTHQQFVDGRWVDAAGGKTLAAENPANGHVIAGLGFKESGFGKDQSMYAIEDYTVVKHVMLKV